QDAEDGRPVASVRDQVGNEEIDRRREEEDEKGEPEDGEREGGGDDRQELEEEPREVEAAQSEVRVVEPAEPVQERAGEDDNRDDSCEREEAGRDTVPRDQRTEREHETDRQDEQGEQDKSRGAAVAGEDTEQRPCREENREAAEVREEGRP